MSTKGEPMTRRSFLRQPALAAAASALAAPAIAGRAADRPPNVLFVICDQMRGDALSCLGHPNARTPHLDRLAAGGVLFENGYCNNPVCVPSRMSMFSGLYPHQTGRLSNKDWGAPLLSMEGTLADHFMQRGYRTGWVGKNHTYRGSEFDQFDTASIRAREPFRQYGRFVPPHWHSDTLWREEDCHPRKNSDEAVEFINQTQAGEPFFLHVSYFDPHPPYMAPAEYTSRYCSAEMRLPETVPPGRLCERLEAYARLQKMHLFSDADLTETLRYYYASIEWGVDAQVGRLMNALGKKGLAEDTIVVFASDHGDFMGDHRMVRKGMFLYDSLLHVPFIWSAPGRIPQGERRSNPVSLIDLFPTLIEMTGGAPRGGLSGRSILAALRGEETEHRPVFASAAHGDTPDEVIDPALNLDDPDDTPLHTRVMEKGMEPKHKTASIRTDEYRLVLNENGPPEFYDLTGRRGEGANVADRPEHAAARRGLEKQLAAWWTW